MAQLKVGDLMLDLDDGKAWIFHMGMSGRLRHFPEEDLRPGLHDHVVVRFGGGGGLVFHDPRRFGAVLWAPGAPESHPLLRHLGVEPLSRAFTGDHLHRLSRNLWWTWNQEGVFDVFKKSLQGFS